MVKYIRRHVVVSVKQINAAVAAGLVASCVITKNFLRDSGHDANSAL
jgi:hypothetical protein